MLQVCIQLGFEFCEARISNQQFWMLMPTIEKMMKDS